MKSLESGKKLLIEIVRGFATLENQKRRKSLDFRWFTYLISTVGNEIVARQYRRFIF